jgi:site-specific DNA-methyltransferase (adenine-specific)/modification methylase
MPPERLKEPNHPTQKPVKLLTHLLKIASNEGDTVLDPFMGVGSTGVASILNNRKFIGIELEKDYYKASVKRLKSCVNQIDLFSEKIKAIDRT